MVLHKSKEVWCFSICWARRLHQVSATCTASTTSPAGWSRRLMRSQQVPPPHPSSPPPRTSALIGFVFEVACQILFRERKIALCRGRCQEDHCSDVLRGFCSGCTLLSHVLSSAFVTLSRSFWFWGG